MCHSVSPDLILFFEGECRRRLLEPSLSASLPPPMLLESKRGQTAKCEGGAPLGNPALGRWPQPPNKQTGGEAPGSAQRHWVEVPRPGRRAQGPHLGPSCPGALRRPSQPRPFAFPPRGRSWAAGETRRDAQARLHRPGGRALRGGVRGEPSGRARSFGARRADPGVMVVGRLGWRSRSWGRGGGGGEEERGVKTAERAGERGGGRRRGRSRESWASGVQE